MAIMMIDIQNQKVSDVIGKAYLPRQCKDPIDVITVGLLLFYNTKHIHWSKLRYHDDKKY